MMNLKLVLAIVALFTAIGINAQPKIKPDETLRKMVQPELVQPKLKLDKENFSVSQKKAVKKRAGETTQGETWTSVGAGSFTDGLLISAFGGTAQTYDVTVEKNNNNANIYRVVEPFGAAHPYFSTLSVQLTYTSGVYMEVDITDPANVTIASQSTGWVYTGIGNVTVSATTGVLNNGVVTFNGTASMLGGMASGSLTITLPDKVPSEAWTEWAPFMPKGDSTGVYINTFISSQNNPIAVYNRYDENMPECQQFKFKNWGATTATLVELILNYNSETGVVTIPKQETGYINSTYGMVSISCSTGTYNAKKGLFTLPVSYSVSAGSFKGPFNDQLKMNGFSDYSFTIKLDDFSENTETSVGTQKFYCKSKDGKKFRYTIKSSAEISSEAVIEAIAKALTGDFTDLTSTNGSVDATGENLNYIIVSSYNEDGEFDSYQYTTFFYSPSSQWTSLGMCDYTDDIASAFYSNSLPICTYKVEIQESKQYTGLYRLKNPYGATFPYHTSDQNYRTNIYMYINATSPTQVKLTYPTNEQMLGADWGYGEMKIQVISGYNNPGTMTNGVITFPQGGTGKSTPFLSAFGNDQYYGNYSGKFKVVIPRDTVTISAANGKATFYSAYNTIVPAGCVAKTYNYTTGDDRIQENVVLEAGDILPAKTGAIIEFAAEAEQDTEFTFIHTAQTAVECTSALSGVTEDTPLANITGSTIYTLANGKNGIGFYPFVGATLAANKAFLAIPITSEVKFVGFDELTGVQQIDNKINTNGAIYNLAGQRIEKLQKGINIINGKKVLR